MQDSEAMQKPGKHAGHKCRLLALPAEWRNRIYHLVLVSDQRIRITPSPQGFQHTDRTHEPSLIQTCRQIRREATTIYYSDNVFRANLLPDLVAWLKLIGEATRAMLKNVQLIRECYSTVARLFMIERDLRDLARQGVPLRPEVLTCGYQFGDYIDREQQFLNESELRARMKDSDWESYRVLLS